MNKDIIDSLKSELSGSGKSISKILNSLALLHNELGPDSWIGIYFYDSEANNLFLGPFEGSPACEYINPGRGVVGTCYAAKRPMYIKDVKEFKGYIACDKKTKSEAVFPMFLNEDVIGVLDVDSPELDGLKDDLDILSEAAKLLSSF